MSLIIFFAIATGFLSLVAPWPEVLQEAAKTVDVEESVADQQPKTVDVDVEVDTADQQP